VIAKHLREGSGLSSVHLRTPVPTIGQRPNEAVLSAHVGNTGLWEAKNLKDEILGVSSATRTSRPKPAGRSTSSPVLLTLALMLVPCPLATFLNRLPGISTFPFDRSHHISCPANIRYVGIQFDECQQLF
jgi:hypothetical protein